MDQLPKSDKDIRRGHWDRYNPINDHLARVVEQLAADFSVAAVDLDKSAENVALLYNTYTLPYGDMAKLPPALFGTITKEEIFLDRPLVVPTDDDEITELAESYHQWAVGLAQSGDYDYVSVPTTDVLIGAMARLRGKRYPAYQWQQSAEATREALQGEPLFTIDIHRVAQINGGAYNLEQLPPELRSMYKQHDEYVLALSQLKPEDGRTPSVRELVQLPVGEYGKEAAEKMARTVVLLGDYIRSSQVIDKSIRDVTADEETKNVLRKHTMRTRESRDRGDVAHIKNGVSDALIGGILSMVQVISYLTAKKVEGYDNYDDLVSDILESDVLEHFARIAPVGYIGPVTLAGIYIPNALDTSGSKLSLSIDVERHLSEMRRAYFAGMAAKWALYDEAPVKHDMPRTLGLTCPASEPQGAIATLRPVLKSFLVN